MRHPVPLLAAAALVLSGCGAADTVLQRVRGDEQSVVPTVSLVLLVPQQSGLTRAGAGVEAAARQAVDDSGGVPGWTIDVQTIDLDADDLSARLDEVVQSDTAVGVITGFEPEDVRTVVPVLDEAGLTILSPADTDPRHFYGSEPEQPLRPWTGYSSVAVDPSPEQTALADHLVRSVGARRVVVLTDGSSEAGARADRLTEALDARSRIPVTVVPMSDRRVGAQVAQVLDDVSSDTAVVVDGPVSLAEAVADEREGAGTLALATRPDALTPEQAAVLAGALSADQGLEPTRGLDELDANLEGDVTGGPFGPAAYDAARLFVDALSRCLPDPTVESSPSRARCKPVVQGTPLTGLTGRVVLDEYGARTGLLPDVQVLDEKGRWTLPGE